MQYPVLCLLVLMVIASMSITAQEDDSNSRGVSGSGSGSTRGESNVFVELFGPTLYKWKVNTEESTMQVDELPTADLLKDKTAVAIYFSASWSVTSLPFSSPLSHQTHRTHRARILRPSPAGADPASSSRPCWPLFSTN
jgi:hypothetical protein